MWCSRGGRGGGTVRDVGVEWMVLIKYLKGVCNIVSKRVANVCFIENKSNNKLEVIGAERGNRSKSKRESATK